MCVSISIYLCIPPSLPFPPQPTHRPAQAPTHARTRTHIRAHGAARHRSTVSPMARCRPCIPPSIHPACVHAESPTHCARTRACTPHHAPRHACCAMRISFCVSPCDSALTGNAGAALAGTSEPGKNGRAWPNSKPRTTFVERGSSHPFEHTHPPSNSLPPSLPLSPSPSLPPTLILVLTSAVAALALACVHVRPPGTRACGPSGTHWQVACH